MFPTRAGGGSVRPLAARVRTAGLFGLLGLASLATAQDGIGVGPQPRHQPGDALALTITTPPDTREVKVTAFSASWPAYRVNERTWEALLGIDLDRKPGPARGGHRVHRRVCRDSATNRDCRAEALSPPRAQGRASIRQSPKDQLARIARNRQFLTEVYATVSDVPAWLNGLQRPVAEVANSSFGSRSVVRQR